MVPTQLRQRRLGSCCHLGWLPVKGGAPECTKKDHRLRKLLLRGGHSSHRNYVMHWPRMQNCYGTRHLHTCYDCYANPVSIRRVRFKSDLKTLDLGSGEKSPPAALRGGSSEGLPGLAGDPPRLPAFVFVHSCIRPSRRPAPCIRAFVHSCIRAFGPAAVRLPAFVRSCIRALVHSCIPAFVHSNARMHE